MNQGYTPNWLTKVGGRRFVMCLGASAMTTALQWAGKLDANGTAYVAIILGTVGAFITGNVLQKRADTFAQRDVSVAQVQSGESQTP